MIAGSLQRSHSRCFVAPEMHFKICTFFLRAPVFFSMFNVRIFARVDFFGALEHSHL